MEKIFLSSCGGRCPKLGRPCPCIGDDIVAGRQDARAENSAVLRQSIGRFAQLVLLADKKRAGDFYLPAFPHWARVLEPLRSHSVTAWGRLFDNIEEPARIQKWIVGRIVSIWNDISPCWRGMYLV
jgi:hypothetical protein